MPPKAQPQASIYEVTIENAALEEALESREKLKGRKKTATKAFKDADDVTKVLIDTELELGDDTPVRVGRFVVTRKRFTGRAVSFETSDSARLFISQMTDLA